MCGIVGFNFNDKNKINELNELLIHRGPDDAGIFCDENISFAQRRLSILDLSDAGHQPMFYAKNIGAVSHKHNKKELTNTSVGIVFNGEIYNFKEIRENLKQKGYIFTSECDTETILASWLEWGEACVKKFNGMWAFCIYDKKKEILFLSKDRMGQKPLYFYHNNNTFIFGSELKIFYKSDIEKTINSNAFKHYLLFGYTPHSETIINKIEKLLPGHSLIFNLTKKRIEKYNKYYEIKFSNSKKSFSQFQEEIKTIIDKSVKRRLLSDVPVGAFLSGGVDSSIIVHFMKKYVKNLKTFSVKFDYPEYNESKWAKIIADKYKTEHHEVSFDANDVKNLINELPQYFDEPFGDASMIPTYLVSKVAAEHVTVCLSGTGSDEIFAGYDRYNEYLQLLKLQKLPKFVKNIIAFTYKQINTDKGQKLKELFNTKDDKLLYIKLFSHLFRNKNEPQIPLNSTQYLYNFLNKNENLNSVLNFDQNIYLANDLLVKEDRASMAHSLETRIPFLDYELIDLANDIPTSMKLKGIEGKYILKKTFEGEIPNEILYRKKKGFAVPLKHYFRKELKTFVEEIIFNNIDKIEFLKKKDVQILWNLHITGKSDYSPFFWNLLMYIKWLETWKK